MKFWNKSGAKDMSDGLFPTYLSAKGEKLSDLEELPEEIKAALECDDTKGIIDLENNYVRAHSRLTYAYGIAYHMTGKTEYLELCRKGAYALSEAFDSSCGGMYTRKNIKTGEWDSDKNARTSQDLAYGITGMGMYYFLTCDEFILEKIVQAKNYIFSTYYDEEKGYFTWYPKDVEDNKTQLVAQLDQLYAYMLMLTPCLPEPYKSEWKSDMKNIADILIERFYSENNLFWGVVNDTEKMSLGGGHNDFGHSVKTLWVIEKVGQIIDEPFYGEISMKTIEQFWSEVKADKELEQKLTAVKDEGELAEFLKANDVEGTIEEFRDLVEKERAIGELPDEELEAVSGGKSFWQSLQDFFSNIDPLYMLMGI